MTRSCGTRRSRGSRSTTSTCRTCWTIAAAFLGVDAAGETYVSSLLRAGLFTLREAILGFVLGVSVGLGLAIVLVHVRVLERGLVPLLVASQTVPIIAIAPVIVVGLKAGWFGVAIVATYLTFFPVTIAALRGMRSADPRAFELMRSYAAGRRTILHEAAAAGVAALPVHGVQDRGHGQRRRRHRRRVPGRHPRGARRLAPPGDAVLRVLARGPVGRDRDVRARRHHRLRRRSSSPSGWSFATTDASRSTHDPGAIA